ncbi:MAG: hypothetical protein HKN47_19585 [Pirellulaceae bacterium]|nr:hypothetical protein [Pirellulaceae bacterium]
MKIIGADFLRTSLESDGYFIKLIINDTAAHFFPRTTEHRDATEPGLCYQDDSLGDALAATIKRRQIDIRFHRAFSDEHVRMMVQRLLRHPDVAGLADFSVSYQGRTLIS